MPSERSTPAFWRVRQQLLILILSVWLVPAWSGSADAETRSERLARFKANELLMQFLSAAEMAARAQQVDRAIRRQRQEAQRRQVLDAWNAAAGRSIGAIRCHKKPGTQALHCP
ncbi:MAG: hypothetical protein KJZ80_00690 [Hyphomicrobiaceae bacterium]|nr:hypothetical protein [Hyphomicrobiaceae bacterium]